MTTYDAIIIGTGQAGPALARRLAGAGMKVAVVERGRFGGTCVNTGCTPTKALVASAYAVHVARARRRLRFLGGRDHGRHEARQGAQGRDCRAVHQGRRAVDEEPEGLRRLSGPCALRGAARGRSRRRVLRRRQIFLNVGGRASTPGIARPRPGPLSHQQLDDGRRFPAAHLLVRRRQLRRAGVRRRCFAASAARSRSWKWARACSPRGRGCLAAVTAFLGREGIDCAPTPNACASPGAATRSSLGLDCTEGAPEVAGSHLLVAIGRRPNTDDLGLDRAGVKPTSAATSRSTTSSAPACPASGRWATATGAAPSPIPRGTTTRSWRPTFSTASSGASATASPPMRSTPTRRSAAPA